MNAMTPAEIKSLRLSLLAAPCSDRLSDQVLGLDNATRQRPT